MVWSGVLLLMLHFVSDLKKSQVRVQEESTQTYLEFTQTPGRPVGECKLQTTFYIICSQSNPLRPTQDSSTSELLVFRKGTHSDHLVNLHVSDVKLMKDVIKWYTPSLLGLPPC